MCFSHLEHIICKFVHFFQKGVRGSQSGVGIGAREDGDVGAGKEGEGRMRIV